MRREIGGVGQWPIECRPKCCQQRRRHLIRPAFKPVRRPVRRCVKCPGFAVTPARLARIARRPGERTSSRTQRRRADGKRRREGGHDRPARRHPHTTQAEQQGRGTGLFRRRQQIGRLWCRHRHQHGRVWPIPPIILADERPAAGRMAELRYPATRGHRQIGEQRLDRRAHRGNSDQYIAPVGASGTRPGRDDALRSPTLDRGHECRVAGPEILGTMIEHALLDAPLRQPTADGAAFVEQPHRDAGIGQCTGTGGARHPCTDDRDPHAGRAVAFASSVSS